MNRRDVLKYFSAGASVPIIGGLPIAQAHARVIEPPKVKVEIADELPPTHRLRSPGDGSTWHVEVRLKSQSGQEIMITGNSYIINEARTKLIYNSAALTSQIPYPFSPDREWELRGL